MDLRSPLDRNRLRFCRDVELMLELARNGKYPKNVRNSKRFSGLGLGQVTILIIRFGPRANYFYFRQYCPRTSSRCKRFEYLCTVVQRLCRINYEHETHTGERTHLLLDDYCFKGRSNGTVRRSPRVPSTFPNIRIRPVLKIRARAQNIIIRILRIRFQ